METAVINVDVDNDDDIDSTVAAIECKRRCYV